jgi:death on curing protein
VEWPPGETSQLSEIPWADLISSKVICELHTEGLLQFGGLPTPIPPMACIDGSLGAAWNAELYAGSDHAIPGLCFSGCLLYYLNMNHCFVEGNKRVAWAACLEVLRQLGLTVNASDDEAEQLFVDIMSSSIKNAIDVSLWLAQRLEALPI